MQSFKEVKSLQHVDLVFRRFHPDDKTMFRWLLADLYELEWHHSWKRTLDGEVEMITVTAHGYCIGRLWIDFEKFKSRNTGFLWALDVFPAFQGQGIGTLLLDLAESILKAKGYAYVELAVVHNNQKAKNLYTRLGYQQFGQHFDRWTKKVSYNLSFEVTEVVLDLRKVL
jgi:GNAT superfamily N-acetyltransferase